MRSSFGWMLPMRRAGIMRLPLPSRLLAGLRLYPTLPVSFILAASRRRALKAGTRWWRSIRLLSSSESRRSEEHTSDLQSLMRISYAVYCLKKNKKKDQHTIEKKAKNQNRTYQRIRTKQQQQINKSNDKQLN